MVPEVLTSMVGIGVPGVRPGHAPHGTLQVGVMSSQEQGLYAKLAAIETRLQQLEKMVYGGSYANEYLIWDPVGRSPATWPVNQ